MEASSQFHDTAALFQAKQHQRPLTTRLGGPQSLSGPSAEDAYLCVLSGTDRIPTVQPAAYSLRRFPKLNKMLHVLKPYQVKIHPRRKKKNRSSGSRSADF